jgi:hypothetical protein
MWFGKRIHRTADGVRLELADEERGLLRQVAEEVRALLEESPEDPALERLFPQAHEDPELEGEFQELTRGQLETGRERALRILDETADSRLLSWDEADGWMRALNDARLVLGTRLDVTEDFDWDGLRPDDPRAQELALYAYLSWIQEQLVEACSTT